MNLLTVFMWSIYFYMLMSILLLASNFSVRLVKLKA
jgi:hypothetical protein